MGYRLRDIVDRLDHDELVKIMKDLNSGGMHLQRLIDDEIKKHEKKHDNACSVCTGQLHPEDTNNFTLVFGPESFKKKASFCGTDCLEYFLRTLKKIKEDSSKVENDIGKF